MRETQTNATDFDTTEDDEPADGIITDGGNRRQPRDPVKALLEDAAGL